MNTDTPAATIRLDCMTGIWTIPQPCGRVVASSLKSALVNAGLPDQGWFKVSDLRQDGTSLWFVLRYDQPEQPGDNRQLELPL